MKELTNSQAIIAIVLILWAIVIGYYLINIFKGMKLVKRQKVLNVDGIRVYNKSTETYENIHNDQFISEIEVNDEENLSTEHKSFLNIVRSETYSHNNQKN